jgi:hypothetical protein
MVNLQLMDLWPFLVAIAGDWVSLMSGIASVSLAILGLRFKVSERRWFWCAGAVCFLLASVRVWTTEQRLVASATPQFVFSANQTNTFYEKDLNTSLVLIALVVLNRGADSVAVGWKAHYDSPTFRSDMPNVHLTNEQLVFNQHSATPLAWDTADDLAAKSMTPIKRGSMVAGRLPLSVPGDRRAEIQDGTATITITVQDYLGREYVFALRSSGIEDFRYLPGERTTR